MKKNIAAWLFVFALMLTYVNQADARCESPDNLNYVSGTAHCLSIKTLSSPGGSSKTLVAAILNIQ